MGDDNGDRPQGARCIALVGPYQSGKTTLLEALLARTGAIAKQGLVLNGDTLGDGSPEARAHSMSTELNVAEAHFLGDHFTFLDCPGNIEFSYEGAAALTGVDAAVVVCEADERKVPALQLILKDLEDRDIPHFLFINKIDKTRMRLRELVPMLQPASARPLVIRQIPIWENGTAAGFIDLALERAFIYRQQATSEVVDLPPELSDREAEARFGMLEKLADYDDELMEQLLEDVEPARDKVFGDLVSELQAGEICPVFFGAAENGNGITRLLKALRHEAPFVHATAQRLGVAESCTSCAHILKTFHTSHAGKLSLVRVLKGGFADGDMVYDTDGAAERISGLFTLKGQTPIKRERAEAGACVGFGRLDGFATGATLSLEKEHVPAIAPPELPPPVYGLAISARQRRDEVKLTGAIGKISEEDPSITLSHNQELGEMVLWGQGEMHLRVALERLTRKFGISTITRPRTIPYRETIRTHTEVRGRHKKQSGGHGQFGDVVIDIKPLPRGSGFEFSDSITGGVVPKQYIPAVESGIRDYLAAGPLGFPVVDVAVHLKDGSYHSVDSSEQAFRMAGRVAMAQGMPNCKPVLLEPIMSVEISVPSSATAKVNQIIAQRRGQILGFDARPGWDGWDVVKAHMPEAEIKDLIIELRSISAGVGSYRADFARLAELTGRQAEEVLSGSSAAA